MRIRAVDEGREGKRERGRGGGGKVRRVEREGKEMCV